LQTLRHLSILTKLKQQKYESSKPDALSLLRLRQFLAADLYQFALVGGTQFNYYGGNAGA
jgi:hypothetical protein